MLIREVNQEPPKKKVYSDKVKAIAAEAMRLSEEDKKAGVTRSESFARLEQTMKKIGSQLRKQPLTIETVIQGSSKSTA